MINISQLSVGDKVHYQPEQYGKDRWENGRVKVIQEGNTESVFVVYNCAIDWENFKDYTAALTNKRDLYMGWRNE